MTGAPHNATPPVSAKAKALTSPLQGASFPFPKASVLLLALPLAFAACGKPHASPETGRQSEDGRRIAAAVKSGSGEVDEHATGDTHQQSGAESETDHHHGHSEGDEGEASVASFDPGHGLTLSPEATLALALQTVQVERREVQATRRLLAQVFSLGPRILATITLSAEDANRLASPEQGLDLGLATLVRVERGAGAASGQAELIVEILKPDRELTIGDFVLLEARLSFWVENRVGDNAADTRLLPLAIPRSALLETANGSFVYKVEGAYFRREEVTTAAVNTDWAALSSGLREGDVIVASPVSQLWLTELRLTKGGGHSH